MKSNGVVLVDMISKLPSPLWLRLTLVALPPKVFPLTVTASVEQVLPLIELKLKVGGLVQPQLTVTVVADDTHPEAFLACKA